MRRLESPRNLQFMEGGGVEGMCRSMEAAKSKIYQIQTSFRIILDNILWYSKGMVLSSSVHT